MKGQPIPRLPTQLRRTPVSTKNPAVEAADLAIRGSAWGAFGFWVLAEAFGNGPATWRRPPRRFFWAAGALTLAAHLALAFQFRRHWSHVEAVAEVRQRTGETFGVYWGGGVWLNYGMTAAWLGDVCREAFEKAAAAPRRPSSALRAFLAFMWLNAAVVFARPPARWLALAAFIVLALSKRGGRRPPATVRETNRG